MQIMIPTELCQYVRMSQKEGLIHSPDMPKELFPLFEKIRKEVIMLKQQRMEELQALLVNEEK
jgi:hypothetical protein